LRRSPIVIPDSEVPSLKNPAVTSAAVLVALALVVGGFAWMATGSRDNDGGATVLTRTEGETVGFVPLSPREQRKKNNLEQSKRELHRIRQTGKEVAPNVFKIEDETGDATYYYGDLIPGKGRDGEPMFLSVEFKRMPAPPLKERKKVPSKITKFDPTRHDNVLKLGDSTAKDMKKGSAGGASGGNSGSSGDGAGDSTGGAKGGAGAGPK